MSKRRFAAVFACIVLCIGSHALALQRDPNDLLLRVIDCGQALCCVAHLPGDRYIIYDAGDYRDDGRQAFQKIQEVIPPGSEIELLVLSHSDSDHIGAVKRICDAYRVKRILRSGRRRDTVAWKQADAAILNETLTDGCIDINLSISEFPMGATYRFGDVYVTMVSGFSDPPAEWGSLSHAEANNAGSIVIRIEYRRKRILLTGDAVGRREHDCETVSIATEKFMLENKDVITIDCDVLVAPHHGADNASSAAFISAVSPQYVIFSAGSHKTYQHPRKSVALRYLAHGVPLEQIFRTDLGDDDGPLEWDHGRIPGNRDPKGDDDVDVVIRCGGAIEVAYRHHLN